MACNFTGWNIIYIDNVSLIKKNVSVFEILELRHETSQVAASQCEVCGGSLETPTHVLSSHLVGLRLVGRWRANQD